MFTNGHICLRLSIAAKIFNIVPVRKELFGYSASWNYLYSGHDKGPSNPKEGVEKQMANVGVKNKTT